MHVASFPERQKEVLPQTRYVSEREFSELLLSRRRLERDTRFATEPALLDPAKWILYLLRNSSTG